MAPLATYEPPHVQLGRLMVLARRRGLSFDEFWMEAVRPGLSLVMVTSPLPPVGPGGPWCVRWPTDRHDRLTWQTATSSAKDGWRRAYEREEATRPEQALVVLAHDIGIEVVEVVAGDRGGEDVAELMGAAA